MDAHKPSTRSTKDIIVRDTYITGGDEQELKRAENHLVFIDAATQGLEEINTSIENLDHLALAESIRKIKPSIISMGYGPLYSHATALENEFTNQIISHPRPCLEDFLVEVKMAIGNANTQLEGMRVALI